MYVCIYLCMYVRICRPAYLAKCFMCKNSKCTNTLVSYSLKYEHELDYAMKNFTCQYFNGTSIGLTLVMEGTTSTKTAHYLKFVIRIFTSILRLHYSNKLSIFVTFTIAWEYAATFNPINYLSWYLTDNSKPHKHPLPLLLIH